jgi:ligand-binding sensor domain-containing protein/serine phosphatase RsbU (regulator of sigma subunit)
MKFYNLIFLLILTISFSCSKENKTESVAEEQNNKTVIKIRRAKLDFKPAGKPIITKASNPLNFITNSNVIPVNELTAFDVLTDLYITTPGEDTLKKLSPFKVIPEVKLCKQPHPIKALPPRFKDASSYNIQYIDVDQGLLASRLKSVIVDKKGNIWIGSNGSGVCKYDGESFLNYTINNGLSNNTILTIFEDSKGNIWFGTEGGGVCWFDGKNFYNLTSDNGLGDNTVLAITEDNKGNIWFGTNGGGAFCFDGYNLTPYTENEGLSNNMVRCIKQDKKGNIWFGTTGSGACKFNGKSFEYYTERIGLNSSIIHAIAEDENGVIYFGTEDGGVNVYDGKTIKYITEKRGLTSNCVVSLLAEKGSLWIGTYDKGLCKFSNSEITTYTNEQGLTNNYILGIAKDLSNNIWMATYGGGLCKLNANSFVHYTSNEGFVNNTVRSIALDYKNNLIFGTFGDGLIYHDGKSFLHFTEKEGLPSNRIMTIVNDSNSVWLGTEQNGIVKFNGTNFELFTTEQGLSSDYIKCSYKDKNGIIWFGTDEGGVCGYNGTQFITFNDDEDLTSAIVNSITEDNNGHIWMATEGAGACCYDGDFLKWFTTKSGVSDNKINCVFKDNEGNIWLGGNTNGISIIDAKTIGTANPKITIIDTKNYLSNNSIKSIIQDNENKFWIATEFGLNLLIKEKNTFKSFIYNTEEGLKANDFMKSSVALDDKNTIWWGTGKALSKLNLNNFKIPNTIPKIQLTSIELEKTFVDFLKLRDTTIKHNHTIVGVKDKKDLKSLIFDSISLFYNYPTKLSLPYNLNQIDFVFSAINWEAKDKIQYQFKLEGDNLETDWSPLVKENKAFYNNLNNDNYVFKVKAVGLSGKWSEVFEYPFTIRAPWYKTMWAYLLYIVAFITIVMGFNNIRTKQLKAKQIELEKVVAERTAEIVEQKELIEEKQKEIVDSINYAKRIQSAMLASDQLFSKNLKNYFVLFEPKDIVSGDFYWASATQNNKFVLVTADSTGHGVPGAMMSMLNISCLNEAINERRLTSPSEILNYSRQRIINSLSEDGSEEGGKDGMDCSVVVFDFNSKQINYAAANNPIWVIRNAKETNIEQLQLIELKPDRMPVGKHIKDSIPFTESVFNLQTNDIVFTLTDGFADQFGGPKQKKYTYKKLKELLLKIYELPVNEQQIKLKNEFIHWKGTEEQVDDVLLIGVKIHFDK